MIDLDYYRTVAETQYSAEILKAELLDLIKECEESELETDGTEKHLFKVMKSGRF